MSELTSKNDFFVTRDEIEVMKRKKIELINFLIAYNIRYDVLRHLSSAMNNAISEIEKNAIDV